MTIEELKKHCEKTINICQGSRAYEEHALVLTLIEKQIPNKPILEGDGYADGEMVYDIWRCPNCDKPYEVDIDEYNYCPNCGKAIDWSEEGEQNEII